MMTTESLTQALRKGLDPSAMVRVRRPGSLYQLNLPAFHEDGDAVGIFVRPKRDGRVTVTDLGTTFMRLSYGIAITDAIMSQVDSVAQANGFAVHDGEIRSTVDQHDLMPALFGLMQIETLAEPIAHETRRHERVSLEFRQSVVDLVIGVFGSERAVPSFHDAANDPDGHASVDVVVHGGARTLAIAAVSSTLSAETAIGTKFLIGPALDRARWLAVPRDFNALTNRTRSRLLREYDVLASTLAGNADIVRAKLIDQAA